MSTKAVSTKDARLEIRISPEEKELCQRAADQDDRPLSNWIRSRLVAVARKELRKGAGEEK